MNKSQWETTLQDAAELSRLADWSRSAAQQAVQGLETGTDILSHGFDAEQPRHMAPLTAAVLAANDRSAVSAPPFHQVASFLPDLQGLSPLTLLETLEARFRADASAGNGLLLQAAINRITAAPMPEAHLMRAAERAADLFGQPDTQHQPPQTDDIWFKAYEHADFGGRSVFEDVPPGWGYWRQPHFGNVGMNDTISSLAYNSSANEVGGQIVLFEHARYFGRYQNYPVTPGRRTDVHYVGNDFNDLASSALIIRRFANETRPVLLGSLIPQSAIADIVNATPRVRPAGDAVFTWDLWPTGGTSNDWHPNDPARTFIYVNVPITVHTPWPWPDYYAQVRYWVYLYVDGGGKLQGYVAFWGYYVEGGTISGSVAAGLKGAIPGTIPKVNGLISQALGLANIGAPYQYVYYLPGRNQLAGNVSEDVTIVAVKR